MENDSLHKEKQIRQLLFWNRLWLVLFTCLAVVALVFWVSDYASRQIHEVDCSWDGDAIRLSTISGGVVVMYLRGVSEDRLVAAHLPTPAFILDSASVIIDRKTQMGLDWRDEHGSSHPTPAIGSPVMGLYYRAQYTTWRGK